MLEAAQRYEERQARRHSRLIAALRPYGDNTTSVDDAVRRAAADLGIDATDRGFDELASLVVAAAETPAGAADTEPFTIDTRSGRGAPRRHGSARVTPAAPWSADELARRALLEQGVAVAVNLRRHHNLIAWAKERRLFVGL